MRVGRETEWASSPTWAAARADVSVLVATYQRPDYLPGLMASLALQGRGIEVIVVDDGSRHPAWEVLRDLVLAAAFPVLAVRVEHTGGPSLPRNTAASRARTELLLVTDDDCLPEPGWAGSLVSALRAGVGVAQGRTLPAEATHGPWDRTIQVERPSGLYETCNLGFRREPFVSVGGFPVLQVIPNAPRGFGEDVVLGAAVARRNGFSWAGDAVVRHRWVPATYVDHLHAARRLTGFPWLVRRQPELARRLPGGVFLSSRTAQFDAAVLSLAVGRLTRSPLVAATGCTPWFWSRSRDARWRRTGRPFAVRMAQQALIDAVALGSLVQGSARHRRLVL